MVRPAPFLGPRDPFPDPSRTGPEGLVALSRSLQPAQILRAYHQGIFPWSVDPVTWWSPDPRALFELQPPPLGRSARKLLAKPPYLVTTDRAFAGVMRACAAPAPGREESWITAGFLRAYTALHRQGAAHSVECWEGTRLVGGVYGLALSGVFCGESMFHRAPNASKLALYWLLDHLSRRGFAFLDSQVPNPATTRLGAVTVPRAEYLRRLPQALALPVNFA